MAALTKICAAMETAMMGKVAPPILARMGSASTPQTYEPIRLIAVPVETHATQARNALMVSVLFNQPAQMTKNARSRKTNAREPTAPMENASLETYQIQHHATTEILARRMTSVHMENADRVSPRPAGRSRSAAMVSARAPMITATGVEMYARREHHADMSLMQATIVSAAAKYASLIRVVKTESAKRVAEARNLTQKPRNAATVEKT
jgi:hypothetical protein